MLFSSMQTLVALPDQALAAVPVGFLRIVGLVLYWLLTRVAATERAKARLWQRQTAKYGPTVRPYHPPCSQLCHPPCKATCMMRARQEPMERETDRPNGRRGCSAACARAELRAQAHQLS